MIDRILITRQLSTAYSSSSENPVAFLPFGPVKRAVVTRLFRHVSCLYAQVTYWYHCGSAIIFSAMSLIFEIRKAYVRYTSVCNVHKHTQRPYMAFIYSFVNSGSGSAMPKRTWWLDVTQLIFYLRNYQLLYTVSVYNRM